MAKFIAQIETAQNRLTMKSEPAAIRRPKIVSIGGSPAATSEPNASTMMPSVTGQLMSSDFSIACMFALLKFAHMPEAPVRLTSTPGPAAFAGGPSSASAASTMPFGSFAAPAWTIAVCPSSEMDVPSAGGTTVETASLPRRMVSTLLMVAWNAGSATVLSCECTTTMSPALERPPNSAWTSSRASTDSESFACQPAPESAFSARSAKTPSARATTIQAARTILKWLPAPPPSRRAARRGREPSSSAPLQAAGAAQDERRRAVAEGDEEPLTDAGEGGQQEEPMRHRHREQDAREDHGAGHRE